MGKTFWIIWKTLNETVEIEKNFRQIMELFWIFFQIIDNFEMELFNKFRRFAKWGKLIERIDLKEYSKIWLNLNEKEST